MSDLKHQTVSELHESKRQCQHSIEQLGSKLAGQKTRMEWIDRYLYKKTPRELSISQIEARLGHKVIIKEQPYETE